MELRENLLVVPFSNSHETIVTIVNQSPTTVKISTERACKVITLVLHRRSSSRNIVTGQGGRPRGELHRFSHATRMLGLHSLSLSLYSHLPFPLLPFNLFNLSTLSRTVTTRRRLLSRFVLSIVADTDDELWNWNDIWLHNWYTYSGCKKYSLCILIFQRSAVFLFYTLSALGFIKNKWLRFYCRVKVSLLSS